MIFIFIKNYLNEKIKLINWQPEYIDEKEENVFIPNETSTQTDREEQSADENDLNKEYIKKLLLNPKLLDLLMQELPDDTKKIIPNFIR